MMYVTGVVKMKTAISLVAYQTTEVQNEMKTSEIARNGRAFTLLIACTATERSNNAKKSDNQELCVARLGIPGAQVLPSPTRKKAASHP
jgi:hypothetical protein